MPRLVGHDVVQYARLLNRVGYLAEYLGIPALIKPIYVILTDKVEIILVLRYHEIIYVQILYELVKDKVHSELIAVDKEHSRVEEIVARNTDYLFNVSAVFIDLNHCLLVAGTYVSVLYVGVVKLADISLNYRIAVDIYCLVVFGEHLGDKQSVIGSLGIVISDRELFGDRVKMLGNVIEGDLEIVVLKIVKMLLHSVCYFCVKHVYPVIVILGRVLYHRAKRDYCIFYKIVVARVKYRYYWSAH